MTKRYFLIMGFIFLTLLTTSCSDENMSTQSTEETEIPIEQLLSEEERNSLYGELLTYDGEIIVIYKSHKWIDDEYIIIKPETSQVYLYGGSLPGIVEGKYSDGRLEFTRSKYNMTLTKSYSGYKAILDYSHKEESYYEEKSWGKDTLAAKVLKKRCEWYVDRNDYEQQLSAIGRIVEFGSYEQDGNKDNGAEPIKWIELSNNGSKRILLSVYLLEQKGFNDKIAQENMPWKKCTLRNYLNTDFFNSAFQDSEKAAIKKNEYGDYICIPSESEIANYFNKETSKALPSFYYQDEYSSGMGEKEYEEYWLRTDSALTYVPLSQPDADAYDSLRSNEPAGVRPVIVVSSNYELNEITY